MSEKNIEYIKSNRKELALMYKRYAEYVKLKLDKRALREQLSEECGELSKAVLKQTRAEGLNDNYTPVSEEDANDMTKEKTRDVLSVMYLLDLLPAEIETYVLANPKWERWAERLGYREKRLGYREKGTELMQSGVRMCPRCRRPRPTLEYKLNDDNYFVGHCTACGYDVRW